MCSFAPSLSCVQPHRVVPPGHLTHFGGLDSIVPSSSRRGLWPPKSGLDTLGKTGCRDFVLLRKDDYSHSSITLSSACSLPPHNQPSPLSSCQNCPHTISTLPQFRPRERCYTGVISASCQGGVGPLAVAGRERIALPPWQTHHRLLMTPACYNITTVWHGDVVNYCAGGSKHLPQTQRRRISVRSECHPETAVATFIWMLP